MALLSNNKMNYDLGKGTYGSVGADVSRWHSWTRVKIISQRGYSRLAQR